jgi:hypothetical protein
MENINLIELDLNDLVQINGGTNEEAYKVGVATGELVGKMVKNFLTLTGVWKLLSLL